MKQKGVAILGSTGSIGRQALEVLALYPDDFSLEVLTAQQNASLLIEQARKYQPNAVVIADEAHYSAVKDALAGEPIKVYAGAAALEQVVESGEIDVVLTALVGFAGLKPTLSAIKKGKNIALANKETLVAAGALVSQAALQHRAHIYPVDSEHSAIFQCLAGEGDNPIEKLILTASGGPFRGKTAEELRQVTLAQALKHPNWSMGRKITVDSSTLMNKGLEVIEARWLFDVPAEKIEVLVHPQSIIHSMVQFADGSVKAQLGLPDMRLPIQYALTYPARKANPFPRIDFAQAASFTFEAPDRAAFPCLDLAYEALARGGNAPCIVNAANEAAVALFLAEKIAWHHIPMQIEKALQTVAFIATPTLDDLVETDRHAREVVE